MIPDSDSQAPDCQNLETLQRGLAKFFMGTTHKCIFFMNCNGLVLTTTGHGSDPYICCFCIKNGNKTISHKTVGTKR